MAALAVVLRNDYAYIAAFTGKYFLLFAVLSCKLTNVHICPYTVLTAIFRVNLD